MRLAAVVVEGWLKVPIFAWLVAVLKGDILVAGADWPCEDGGWSLVSDVVAALAGVVGAPGPVAPGVA